MMATPSAQRRSDSPLVKQPPKIIRSKDDLYVKLSDLPEEIREHLRLVRETEDNNSDSDAGETSLQPYDDVVGGPDSSHARSSSSSNSMTFDEPKCLSAQPTVEEIQMCFAQIDLAILMDHHGKPQQHSRSRSTSPTKSHHCSNCSFDVETQRQPPRPVHRTMSPSPRCKEKRPAAQKPATSPPISLSPPVQGAAARKDQYHTHGYNGFNSDEPIRSRKDEKSSHAKPSKNMEELLDCIGRRQGKNAMARAKESKKKGSENNIASYDGSHDEEDEEDGLDHEEEEGVASRGRAESRRQVRNKRFCGVGALSMLRNDFKTKLQQMHALASPPASVVASIHEGSGPKGGVWGHHHHHHHQDVAGAAHHVRYKSSWSGTSQEEYHQIDPNQDSDNQP